MWHDAVGMRNALHSTDALLLMGFNTEHMVLRRQQHTQDKTFSQSLLN